MAAYDGAFPNTELETPSVSVATNWGFKRYNYAGVIRQLVFVRGTDPAAQ